MLKILVDLCCLLNFFFFVFSIMIDELEDLQVESV